MFAIEVPDSNTIVALRSSGVSLAITDIVSDASPAFPFTGEMEIHVSFSSVTLAVHSSLALKGIV